MMNSKMADHHLARQACIYIRQSTPGQVRFNQESKERQYNLASQAKALGWMPEQIRILDGDLGHSGEQATHRDDFKTLVSDVAMVKSAPSSPWKLRAWRDPTRIGTGYWNCARSPKPWCSTNVESSEMWSDLPGHVAGLGIVPQRTAH
jgi:hypothetical protein